MTAPEDEALKLQRPLLKGALRIVARGVKEDAPGAGRLSDEAGRALRLPADIAGCSSQRGVDWTGNISRDDDFTVLRQLVPTLT